MKRSKGRRRGQSTKRAKVDVQEETLNQVQVNDQVQANGQVEANNHDEEEENSDLFLRVFGNDLILRYLEKLISFEDLKNLRLVNRQLNDSVLHCTKFVSRAYFTINKDLIASGTLKNIGFPVKYAQIDCFRANPFQRHICRRLCFLSPETRGVYVRRVFDTKRASESDDDTVDYAPKLPRVKVWRAEEIEHVYEACKDLEELSVVCDSSEFAGSCLCDVSDASSFPIFPSVKRVLESAESLKKLSVNSKFLAHVTGGNDRDLKPCLKNVTEMEIAEGCDWIPEGLSGLNKLERFKRLGDIILEPRDQQAVTAVVIKNAKTLRSLSFTIADYGEKDHSLKRLGTLKFPNLQHVELNFDELYVPTVIKFLRNQWKTIQSLTLNILTHSEKFPADLLAVLPMLTELVDLRIYGIDTFIEEMASFAVLKELEKLKTLKINLAKCPATILGFSFNDCFVDLVQLVNYVPEGVKHLSLQGSCEPKEGALSTQQIASLSNLTSLTLLRCLDTVTNETLQAIFTHLTSLKELVLTRLDKCDNKGFVGVGQNKVSIQNLEALEKLTIHDSRINNATVYKAIRFPKLTVLDITQNDKLTLLLSIRNILNRNPQLEVLRVPYVADIRGSENLAKVKKEFPKLRLLQIHEDNDYITL